MSGSPSVHAVHWELIHYDGTALAVMVLSDLQQAFLRPPGPCKRSAAGRYTLDAVPAVVPDGGINALSGLRALQQAFLRPPGPRKRNDAGRYTSDTVPAVVPDGGINALSGLRVPHRLNSVGPRKRSAAGRYTSDAVPAVVPDGGINALSGLRVLCWFKQRRPAQAQRRRAIHIRHRTRGCAGWRHKCLIRPAGPLLIQTA